MPAQRRDLHLPLACLAVALAVAGCASAGSPASAPMSLSSLGSSSALNGLAIEGKAMVPANLLSNNGAGIIANDGGGLLSNNGGGIIANNSSRYGLLALSEAPLANALAYLTDPADQFYKSGGKMITTTTSAQGKYRFAQGLPRKKPVIVNVILSENRRVVGFTVPDSGVSKLDISIATTYVTEFLRAQASRDGKTMADFDLKQLPAIAALTQQALDDSTLPVPNLAIGAIPTMNQGYAVAVGQNLHGLGDAWAKLLGRRVIAVTTVAGSGVIDNGGDGKPALDGEFYRLKSVVMDASGNMLLADEGNHRVRRIDAKTGLLSTIAGTGDRGFLDGPAKQAMFNFPRALTLDKQGNLYIFDSQNCRVRKFEPTSGTLTTFAGDPESKGNGFWASGHGGDGGPASKAKLFSPRGGAFDSQGNLYVTDGLKGTNYHLIRKITPDGTISTFAGIPDTPGSFSGDGGPANQAHLHYTNQIWITPSDQLYVADSNNDCIRKIDLRTQIITTVAGVGGQRANAPTPSGGLATQSKLNQPYGVAVDAKGQIYISERGFGRVLVVKTDGRLSVLAGGGHNTDVGEGPDMSFAEPHDLWIEPSGNLLLTESRGGKLRRIWTQFGF